jgi:hypothetical protein
MGDQESITTVENVLLEFENISGLVCNFAKSSIMFFGDTSMANTITTKFTKTNVFSLLGMTIDSKVEKLHDNFKKTKEKMQKVVNFWARFNLSFKGRVAIAKCFLLSQINYLGCIVTPKEEDLIWMQNLMDSFCTGPLRISKEKLYVPANQGGLGLINISAALVAQQTCWFKRAAKSTRDNWRYDLWICGSGNCLTPDPDILDPVSNPILFSLTESYYTFLAKFYQKDNNFLDSFILNNPCTTNGFPYNLRTKFWTQNGNTNMYCISALKIRDFLNNYRVKPYGQLNTEFNLSLSFTTYIRLYGVLSSAIKKFCKLDEKSQSINNFLNRFRKGSKPIRNVLSVKSGINVLNSVANAFSTVTSIANLSEKMLSENLELWNVSHFPNSFCDFIFKFYHNRLGLNTRISHFTDNNRWCTFCAIVGRNLGPFPDETFTHIFFECPTVAKIHDDIKSSLLPDTVNADKPFWLGLNHDNIFVRCFILAVQYQIWSCKLSMRLPESNYCAGEAVYSICHALKANKKLKQALTNIDCPLSRLWDRLCAPRW